MTFFTRKSVKDEIKDLLTRAENLYIHNIKIELESANSKHNFSEMVAKLKNLTEINIEDNR